MRRTDGLQAASRQKAKPSAEHDGFPRDGGGPRAMTRVIRLCDRLARAPAGMTLSELSTQLDTPKSTLLNSLRPLVQDDFLVVDGPLYRLGPGAFRLAAHITSAWSLPRLMAGYLRELWEKTEESVGLGVPDWASGRTVFIDTIQSPKPVIYHMRVGVSVPFYASAAGRLMMAHAPSDWLENYLHTTRFKRLTPHTEIDPDVIRREVRLARDQGYWLSTSQLIEDTATVAAPVFDANGRIVAAIAIGGPEERLKGRLNEAIAAAVSIGHRASGHVTSDHLD